MFTKTDLAEFYNWSLPKLRRGIEASGILKALPKLGQHKAPITAADMPLIEAHLGPCPGWRRYLKK